MAKSLLTLTWQTCCRIIRIVPVLADSGAFVAGVLALLSQYKLSLALGVTIVVLGLVGIDALIKRLERSRTLNDQKVGQHTPPGVTAVTEHTVLAPREHNRRQCHATAAKMQTTEARTQNQLVRVRFAGEKYELRLALRRRPLNITIGEGNSNGTIVEIQED